MLSDYSFHIASTPRCLSFDKCFLKLFHRISKIRLLIQLSDSIMYFCVQIPFKNGFKNKEGLLVQEGERSRSSCHQVKLGPRAHRVSSRLSLASFFPLSFKISASSSHMLTSRSCRLLTATTPNAGGELHTKPFKRKRRDSSSSSHGREDFISWKFKANVSSHLLWLSLWPSSNQFSPSKGGYVFSGLE